MQRVALILFCLAGAGTPALAREPYEGLWADTQRSCRATDGVERLEINGNRFFWYETRCTASGIKADGRGGWTMRMSCEGEGERFRASPRLSQPRPDRLVIENAPVGPNTKRQTYVLCRRL